MSADAHARPSREASGCADVGLDVYVPPPPTTTSLYSRRKVACRERTPSSGTRRERASACALAPRSRPRSISDMTATATDLVLTHTERKEKVGERWGREKEEEEGKVARDGCSGSGKGGEAHSAGGSRGGVDLGKKTRHTSVSTPTASHRHNRHQPRRDRDTHHTHSRQTTSTQSPVSDQIACVGGSPARVAGVDDRAGTSPPPPASASRSSIIHVPTFHSSPRS